MEHDPAIFDSMVREVGPIEVLVQRMIRVEIFPENDARSRPAREEKNAAYKNQARDVTKETQLMHARILA